MKVLVVNAGSSSLKYKVINMDDERILSDGVVECIGLPTSRLKHNAYQKATASLEVKVPDYIIAIRLVLEVLTNPLLGVIESLDEIDAVGHRVLHGGTEFSESVVINDAVKAAIRKCILLGPLHNPANLMGIEACEKVMPTTPQIAVFDTAFHQTMPAKAYMYGVPKKYHDELGVRRYGFHGTSHRYVSKRVCEYLGIPQEGTKIIICHLGNGSSLSACVDGKCVDTSMGLTPLEGLLMGTRSGSCDPAVVQFIANNANMDVNQVLDLMNKKSGLYGIAGEGT
ncbi:MAG: acetate/propionate family kinase, partial [Clostridia bacterium]|nr:acetate/propionate family kinase [Clostridia bacterium]